MKISSLIIVRSLPKWEKDYQTFSTQSEKAALKFSIAGNGYFPRPLVTLLLLLTINILEVVNCNSLSVVNIFIVDSSEIESKYF